LVFVIHWASLEDVIACVLGVAAVERLEGYLQQFQIQLDPCVLQVLRAWKLAAGLTAEIRKFLSG
jgi:hypothetical protein